MPQPQKRKPDPARYVYPRPARGVGPEYYNTHDHFAAPEERVSPMWGLCNDQHGTLRRSVPAAVDPNRQYHRRTFRRA